MVSEYLTLAISQLQDRYGFKQIFIAAHSMGGLIARSYIKKYTEKHPDLSASIHYTINNGFGYSESKITRINPEK